MIIWNKWNLAYKMMNRKHLTENDIKTNSQNLIVAAYSGNFDEVKQLIPVSDLKADEYEALKVAAIYGYTNIVQLLIPVSDPKTDNSQALRCAAQNGHTECVKLLIPVSDPKANDSAALRWATQNGHAECIKLLIPVSDYSLVLNNMIQGQFLDITLLQHCIDEYEVMQQKEHLQNSLQDVNKNSVAIKRKL